MTVGQLIAWLVIGIIAGWAAGMVMRGHGYGLIGNIVIGIIGAIVGGWVFGLLGIGTPGGNGFLGSIATAFVGAVILLAVIGALRRA